MDENILRFRVGIFVVIAMCILGILIFLNSDEGWGRQKIVFIRPTKAPGVKLNTPIRKYGILIGRVKSVEPKDGYVLLGLGINEDEQVFENEVVSIGSESILGDAGIEILPLPKEDRGAPLTDLGVLKNTEVRRDPFAMIVDLQPQINNTFEVMQEAGNSVKDTSDQIGELAANLQSLFQDDQGQLKAALTEFRETNRLAQGSLDRFNRIFENILEVQENPEFKGNIRDALAEIPRVLKDFRELIGTTREAVTEFRTIPEGVNASFVNIKELTDQLKLQAPEVLNQVNSSLKNADELVAQIKRFTVTLNKIDLEKGTVGKLLNDPAIHDAILETALNVEETSAKLEPLINDLRLFADAIARNPGAIVKGAIHRGGDANYKGTAGRDGGIFK